MAKSRNVVSVRLPELPKSLPGIQGLDEITFGGLPQRRPTLICGGPGTGKTLLTQHGRKEYVADCVIFLDHRVTEQISTRRL